MRDLWVVSAGDMQKVAKAYAELEMQGKVQRKSNRNSLAAEEYANRLINDGLKKGWL